MSANEFMRPSVSNGHPGEQAQIRQWWHEVHHAKGSIVWEYYLGDCYLDAMWFPETGEVGAEYPGKRAPMAFPLGGKPVVLCEAKTRLTPGLVGQALLYSALARRAGADVRSVVIFAQRYSPSFRIAAIELGLEVVIPEES